MTLSTSPSRAFFVRFVPNESSRRFFFSLCFFSLFSALFSSSGSSFSAGAPKIFERNSPKAPPPSSPSIISIICDSRFCISPRSSPPAICCMVLIPSSRAQGIQSPSFMLFPFSSLVINITATFLLHREHSNNIIPFAPARTIRTAA